MAEPTPSPQCVGLEFVRQYYTVLNKAPNFLHRFYNQDSQLVHPDARKNKDVVIGQSNIHEKIMSLNFIDCHAKIKEVDSVPTISNGIMISVAGELSNNAGPMRKFSQSIVLAPQAARKYYVSSDIFKYLDDVFEEHSSDESEDEADVSVPLVQQQEEYAPAAVNGTAHVEEDLPNLHLQDIHHVPSQPSAADPPAPPPSLPAPTVSPIPPAAPILAEPAGIDSPSADDEWSVGSNNNEDQDTVENDKTIPTEPEETKVEIPSNEPKTYANLLKKPGNQSMPYSIPESTPVNNMPSKPPRAVEQRPPRTSNFGNNDSGFGPKPPRTSGFGGDFDDRKRVLVSDSQQVFVGNLPHTINEDELKEAFSQFGKVVDIRINTAKGKTSVKGIHTVPNFGFISFDNEDAVQKCLDARPIYLPDESRINVEEKKARSNRMDGGPGGPPPPRGRGVGRGGMSRGGPRGGTFTRDRGAPRGGFGGRR